MSSAQFVTVSAFSTTPFDGNPATVTFIDLKTPLHILQGLSKNFNQPMAVFLNPLDAPSPGQTTLTTDIRFVPVSGSEVQLCGHGSLAAAKAVLSLPSFLGSGIDTFEFQSRDRRAVIRVKKFGDDLFELQLPASQPEPVPEEEQQKLRSILNRAFSREVRIKTIGVGGEGFKHVILIEIDAEENLSDIEVDHGPFKETGYPVNVVTSLPSGKISEANEAFVSRMFSPWIPGGEDHVCGTAHCLLVPYWHLQKGVEQGVELVAKQVSPRGGILRVMWDGHSVKLRGSATVLASGVCHFA